MRACVVDDDYTSRVLLSELLEDQDWEVIQFDHPENKSIKMGTVLVKELGNPETKLIIMDIRFGRDANGLRLGRETIEKYVHNNTIKAHCLVIFVSQFGREPIGFDDIEKACKEKGIEVNWFDKPVDFVGLLDKIDEFRMNKEKPKCH